MALSQYEQFLDEHKEVENTKESRQIISTGERIARAAQKYYEFKGAPDYLKDYAWEYNLVQDPQKKCLVYARREDCVLFGYITCSSK